MTEKTLCRCPVRPYAAPGSFASASNSEGAAVRRWMDEHGGHQYALWRDNIAMLLQSAENQVRDESAVRDMLADIFDQPRPSNDMHPRAGGIYKERTQNDAVDRTRAYDWSKVPVEEIPNVLMNYFGQDQRYGYEHPIVTQALFRVREAIARVSNALDER